jgi:hypothetical protein
MATELLKRFRVATKPSTQWPPAVRTPTAGWSAPQRTDRRKVYRSYVIPPEPSRTLFTDRYRRAPGGRNRPWLVPLQHNDGALSALRMTWSRRSLEMNGTTNVKDRSVQLAVISTPSASVNEAVAEARRRTDTPGPWDVRLVGGVSLRTVAAAS